MGIERLYFGCGTLDYHAQGYKNVDVRRFQHVDYVCDVSKRLPFVTDSIHEILAESILEHIPHGLMNGCMDGISHLNTIKVLCEWRRVLKPGCVCIIKVPNLYGVIQAFNKKQMPPSGFWMLLYGGQDYQENTHCSGFYPETLKDVMQYAGFRNVRLCNAHSHDDPLDEETAWEMTAIGVK